MNFSLKDRTDPLFARRKCLIKCVCGTYVNWDHDVTSWYLTLNDCQACHLSLCYIFWLNAYVQDSE